MAAATSRSLLTSFGIWFSVGWTLRSSLWSLFASFASNTSVAAVFCLILSSRTCDRLYIYFSISV